MAPVGFVRAILEPRDASTLSQQKDPNITSPHICHIFKICTRDICHYLKYVRHFSNMRRGYIRACLPCQNGNFLHDLDFGPKVTQSDLRSPLQKFEDDQITLG